MDSSLCESGSTASGDMLADGAAPVLFGIPNIYFAIIAAFVFVIIVFV